MPQYNKWKLNIALIYGDDYSKEYCTWKRYLEHMEVLAKIGR